MQRETHWNTLVALSKEGEMLGVWWNRTSFVQRLSTPFRCARYILYHLTRISRVRYRTDEGFFVGRDEHGQSVPHLFPLF